MAHSADPFWFNDDVRQWIFGYYRYFSPELFRHDYIVDYYLALDPLAHGGMYRLLSPVIDPAVTSKILPYVQYLLLLVGLCWSARALSGWLGVWSALALTLSSREFMSFMAGGLARGWGFPLAALTLAALLQGRLIWLAVLTCCGAAFYPPAGVLSGTVLALALVFARPDAGPVAAWSRRWRVLLLLGTVLICLALVLPNVWKQRAYGQHIGPDNLADYPEAGPGGRWGPDDRPPFRNVLVSVGDEFGRTLQGDSPGWGPGLPFKLHGDLTTTASRPLLVVSALVGLVVVAGFLVLIRRGGGSRMALLFLGAAMLDYLAAVWFTPLLYLPQRFTALAVPVLTVVVLPAAAGAFFATDRFKPWLKPVATLALTFLVLVSLGGRGGPTTGLTVHIESDRNLYRYLADLSPDSIIAGWPDGVMDNVPYLSRRSVLLTKETHQAFFIGYLEEARRRMKALIRAYYAVDLAPLLELRRQFGVTHLVVDTRHYLAEPPRYFAPFDELVMEARARSRAKGCLTARLAAERAVFRVGPWAVIDLTSLEAGKN